MQLTEAQAGACAALAAPGPDGKPREAWSGWDDLAAAHGAAVLESLVAAGVMERWQLPGTTAVTLTPWGAAVLARQIAETWRPKVERHEERDESRPCAAPRVRRERCLIETPTWGPFQDVAAKGKGRPVRLPKYGRVGTSLVDLEQVPDHRPGPEEEVVMGEDGEPATVFAGADPDARSPLFFASKMPAAKGLRIPIGGRRRPGPKPGIERKRA